MSGVNNKQSSGKGIKTLLRTAIILLVAILLAGLLAGGWVLYKNMTEQQKADISSNNAGHVNMLWIVSDGTDNPAYQYALFRFDYSKKSITVTAIPPKLLTSLNEKSATLDDQMKYGGALQVKSAAEKALKITIDKYVLASMSTVESLVEQLGGVEMQLPTDLNYVDTAGTVITDLKAGAQTLNGQQAVSYLRYPAWQNGWSGMMKAQNLFYTTLFNQHNSPEKLSNCKLIYESLVGSVKTDVSNLDITQFSISAKPISETKNPSVSIAVSASFIGENAFLSLEESTMKEIASAYGG